MNREALVKELKKVVTKGCSHLNDDYISTDLPLLLEVVQKVHPANGAGTHDRDALERTLHQAVMLMTAKSDEMLTLYGIAVEYRQSSSIERRQHVAREFHGNGMSVPTFRARHEHKYHLQLIDCLENLVLLPRGSGTKISPVANSNPRHLYANDVVRSHINWSTQFAKYSAARSAALLATDIDKQLRFVLGWAIGWRPNETVPPASFNNYPYLMNALATQLWAHARLQQEILRLLAHGEPWWLPEQQQEGLLEEVALAIASDVEFSNSEFYLLQEALQNSGYIDPYTFVDQLSRKGGNLAVVSRWMDDWRPGSGASYRKSGLIQAFAELIDNSFGYVLEQGKAAPATSRWARLSDAEIRDLIAGRWVMLSAHEDFFPDMQLNAKDVLSLDDLL